MVKNKRAQMFVCFRLVLSCPSKSFQSSCYLLASKFRDWISYSYTVNVSTAPLVFLVKLFYDIQLLLVLCFVHYCYVIYKE